MTESAEQTQSGLIGHALDAAVAALEGADVESPPAYSTDSAIGHPIIEREHITTVRVWGRYNVGEPYLLPGTKWMTSDTELRVGNEWAAMIRFEWDGEMGYTHHAEYTATGPTALIAAMRCYVLSKSHG